jgi:hypothetical protein
VAARGFVGDFYSTKPFFSILFTFWRLFIKTNDNKAHHRVNTQVVDTLNIEVNIYSSASPFLVIICTKMT